MTSQNSGTYDAVISLTSSGGSGTGAISYAATGTACEVPATGANAGKLVITSGTGTCSVTATKAADDNYTAISSAAQTITVAKAAQAALTMTSQNSGTFDDVISLTSSGGSGTAHHLRGHRHRLRRSPPPGRTPASSSSPAAPATCSVTATKAADDNYTAVSSAAQSVHVSKAARRLCSSPRPLTAAS